MLLLDVLVITELPKSQTKDKPFPVDDEINWLGEPKQTAFTLNWATGFKGIWIGAEYTCTHPESETAVKEIVYKPASE